MMFHPMLLAPLMGLRMVSVAGGMIIVPVVAAAMIAWSMLSVSKSRLAQVGSSRIDEAVEIVRQRFAHGEIDAAEYNRIVTGLTRPS
jgi:uncharacterized membrane protein